VVWIRGLAYLMGLWWELLERPPPWPDPAPYVVDSNNNKVGWGYSLRGGQYVRHCSCSGQKSEGWVITYTATYFCTYMPFSQLLWGSVSYISTIT